MLVGGEVVLGSNPTNAMNLVNSGFRFAARLMMHPRPVIVACTGHAIAMGLFTLLSADYRLGAEGAFKFVANEVAIGMTLPRPALEICRNRLAPAQFQRAMLLSEVFSPGERRDGGHSRSHRAGLGPAERSAGGGEELPEARARRACGDQGALAGPVAKAVLAAIDTDMAELKLAG